MMGDAVNVAESAAPILNLEGLQDAFNDRVLQFLNFFDRDFKRNDDQTSIKQMVAQGKRRHIVNMDQLYTHDPVLHRWYQQNHGALLIVSSLLKTPLDLLPAIQKALREVILAVHAARIASDIAYHVGFKGPFADNHLNPRTLSAAYIGQMVALEGIVTRISLVRPKMHRSVHYCDRTQLFHTREYRDSTMVSSADPNALLPTSTTYPLEDENGNPLTTEFGYCTFRDHQILSMQEMPEKAPAGQLPRSVDVIFDDDLVDTCKPGDRVQIVGVYRAVGGASGHSSFRTLLVALNVRHLDREVARPTLTELDVANIVKLSHRKDAISVLSRSLAPSIYGHDFIKKAILLLLLGGLEHNLENGTHIRGDINMLLLGDPSTAKSQFLRFVMSIAPLAIATTGRGSSGVGLTAAVTQDKETGERRLEAGAMVLADRGVVCIDEFDKMSEADRVAIHEVMEQQTITIAKAGIHTSLNARCSVIAAANPTYGQYDENLEPHRNIRLPDSLLSRFDLLFVILDKTDEAMDRKLSSHVLKMHQYVPPGLEEGQPLPPSIDNEYLTFDDGPVKDTVVYENRVMETASGRISRKKNQYVSLTFLKKYIHYAKSRIHPRLTEEARRVITESYAEFRQENSIDNANRRRTLPVTARTLETLIRLSTAHAKARLDRNVTEKDAEAAVALLKFALFKEFEKKRKPRNKKQKIDNDNASESSGSEDGDIGPRRAQLGNQRMETRSQSTPMEVDANEQTQQSTESNVVGLTALMDSSQISDKARMDDQDIDYLLEEHSPVSGIAVFDQVKSNEFRRRMDTIFQESDGLVAVAELLQWVNMDRFRPEGSYMYTTEEAHLYLDRLELDQGVFIDRSAGRIYRI